MRNDADKEGLVLMAEGGPLAMEEVRCERPQVRVTTRRPLVAKGVLRQAVEGPLLLYSESCSSAYTCSAVIGRLVTCTPTAS